MLKTIAQYIKTNNLLPIADHKADNEQYKVLVAVSGGADSIALLHILHSLNYNCIVAHCNFHLRGAESDRDELFVREFCNALNVELYVKHFDTFSYMKNNHLSLEMAARELRYEWFKQLQKQTNSVAIAVAHNKNDQAETIILNLQRGTGIKGLCGMYPKNNDIIRPLLNTSRQEIEHYLAINKLTHIEDSTNSDTKYQRNSIRQQLTQWQPSQIANTAHAAELMKGYAELIKQQISQYEKELVSGENDLIKININKLTQKVASRTILYELLYPYGFYDLKSIYESLNGESGRVFYSDEYVALKDREYLLVYKQKNSQTAPQFLIEQISIDDINSAFPFKSTSNDCFLDAKNINIGKLNIRHWQNGDFFYPFGMNMQKKKISDFFTDNKLSLKQKQDMWLLTDDKNILWVIGYRTDERYKITEQTKNILHISIK